MADEPSTETVPEDQGTPAPQSAPVTDWEAEAARLKAEARKWEDRAKENDPLLAVI